MNKVWKSVVELFVCLLLLLVASSLCREDEIERLDSKVLKVLESRGELHSSVVDSIDAERVGREYEGGEANDKRVR